MKPIYIDYLNALDIDALAMTDGEIIAAVEAGLVAQGKGETVIEPRVHLEPDPSFHGHFNVLRGYVAPLVDALQEAQRTGELREDVPVRLMRDMVFGAMEHVLWGFVASGRKPELDATAQQLTDVFMDGFAARPAPWQALRRFHADIVAAVHALDAHADGQQATPPP